ncbi:hypothetical protein Ccrd_010619 [Cynara cardunculus var. scolymus]|uniref:Helicase MAGATAMA 3 n=1 Tax=Cynara cardunculus var. scolymus TaxID=59895 RepID=A0A118K6N6_CYNCS|nr:hypothetical protein Ccrd_010619 [Cynara cardunculus var. scolymus]
MAIDRNLIEEEGCLHRFYKIVLGWDYLRLLKESSKKSKNTVNEKNLGLKHVKDTYKDVDDYLGTFEPLLFEEVKAQIVQGKNEEEETEWKMGMVIQCHETDGFHLPEIFGEDWGSVSQNDLLLLTKKKFGDDNELPTTYAFALVEHRLPDKIRLRMQLDGEIKRVDTDESSSSKRLLKMRSLIVEQNKTWSIMKICSLSTIAREYVALRSISSLPYKDLILTAADSIQNSEDQAWKISKPLMEFIQTNHNTTQLEAIRAGLSRRKFVLIQVFLDFVGPPGTGKTQTILGLLSAILHATPARIHAKGKINEIKRGPDLHIQDKNNHWGKASPWLYGINPRDAKMPKDGDDGFFPTTGSELKPEVVNSSRKYRVRVLVCAPSNSALDEIVLRLLSTGIRDENDRAYTPKIVRIGLKAHHSVQAVSMDYLVEQKLAGMDFQTADKQKHGGGARDRDTIRASIMDESAIVFSTLSFSGSSLFTKLGRNFDIVVIDEAAQAVEPATLVPLASGCKQVFLVGDPVQLPATVISPVAEKFGYSMSLFKRFQKAGYPVQMLKTQYRMHPEPAYFPQIRSFPSKEFYNGELEDGADIRDRTKRLWHKYRCFGPFCFFDIHEGQETQPSGSGSWENVDEVDFSLLMYHKLVSSYPELKSSSRLAIISPYRHQVKLFRSRFKETFGIDSEKVVDINTVDGFQGREKDVAIFSCVRASKERGIGFVADFRRMNVGITRARASVLVSKPYTEFFSDNSLTSMMAEEAMPEGLGPDDMDTDALGYDLAVDADQAPVDDDYGDDVGGGDDGGMDD